MAQVCVLETTAQLKSPPEKLYNILKSQNHRIPNAYTVKIHDVEVHEGDWESPGSLKVWKYTLEGKEVFKERIEVDEENKTLTFVAVGGNVRELYKSFRTIMKFEMRGTLKLRMEYEKLSEEVPAPDKYLQFVLSFMEDIDKNLV